MPTSSKRGAAREKKRKEEKSLNQFINVFTGTGDLYKCSSTFPNKDVFFVVPTIFKILLGDKVMWSIWSLLMMSGLSNFDRAEAIMESRGNDHELFFWDFLKWSLRNADFFRLPLAVSDYILSRICKVRDLSYNTCSIVKLMCTSFLANAPRRRAALFSTGQICVEKFWSFFRPNEWKIDVFGDATPTAADLKNLIIQRLLGIKPVESRIMYITQCTDEFFNRGICELGPGGIDFFNSILCNSAVSDRDI